MNILKFLGWFIIYAVGTVLGFVAVALIIFVLINFSLIIVPLFVLGFVAYLAIEKVKSK